MIISTETYMMLVNASIIICLVLAPPLLGVCIAIQRKEDREAKERKRRIDRMHERCRPPIYRDGEDEG
jgi:hypothetical protein